jgi:hypothetical protein
MRLRLPGWVAFVLLLALAPAVLRDWSRELVINVLGWLLELMKGVEG